MSSFYAFLLSSFFVLAVIVATIVIGNAYVAKQKRKVKERKESLRGDHSGGYVWTNFDGTKGRSDVHPEAPGGAWHMDAGTGDGGDGGGDGGGD